MRRITISKNAIVTLATATLLCACTPSIRGIEEETSTAVAPEPPRINITSPTQLTEINTTSETFSGTCTLGVPITITYGSGASGSSRENCVGNGMFSFSVALSGPTGARIITIRQTDSWNQSSSQSRMITYHRGVKYSAYGVNTRIAQDYEGYSVAISGDTLVSGASQQGYDENGGNLAANAGAAYVYVRSGATWALQQKLVATGLNARIAADQLGSTVAISGDTIAIGAPFQDYDENGGISFNDMGAVYVFTRAGNTWTQQQKIVVPVGHRSANQWFAERGLALDGDTLAIGTRIDALDEAGGNNVGGAGAVYIYTRTLGTWSLQQKLVGFGVNGRGGNDWLGYSLALSGDTLAAGAGWHNYDALGANDVSNAGAVFVYTRTAGVWSSQQKLIATGINARVAEDLFGVSVGLSGDRLVVGASQEGYDAEGANFLNQAGAAYVFTRNAGVWSLQQKLTGTGINGRIASDNFGDEVGISDDTIAVDAALQDYDADGVFATNNGGAVYVFSQINNTWSLSKKILQFGLNEPSGGRFGEGIAISPSGLIIGHPYNDYDEGGANGSANAGAWFVFY